ncbi:MAG: L,D-transpeptidase [Chloroflexi bacterium]|nr:L,D-transpeptidase [Chloroflexota bacterium]
MMSRRAVLKSIGLIGLAAAAGAQPAAAQTLTPETSRWSGQPLGRVSSAYMNYREAPSTDADIVGNALQDDLVRVRRAVPGQTVYRHNNLWLETARGFLYSSFVQPVWYHLPNTPVSELGGGRWAQVTVPYTDAYWDPDGRDEARWVDRFYYGSTIRVTELVAGADGLMWYKARELYQSFHMRATHLNLLDEDALTPLSPEVDRKWIDVNLSQQVLTCYEGDTPVFSHLVSTGLSDYATPTGTHYVFDKRLSERMVGGRAADDEISDRYNLGGVPFTCYITGDWVAIHGCYWHNDYGIPRSHGCINLPNDAARFVWRWTTPAVADESLDDLFVRGSYHREGTRVEVHY